jgi:hypothetical protein
MAKLMFEVIEEHGLDKINIRSYSGRCMFGKECLGLDCNNVGEALNIIFLMTQKASTQTKEFLLEEMETMIQNTCQDSMGRGIIVYWPDIKHDRADQDQLESDTTDEDSEGEDEDITAEERDRTTGGEVVPHESSWDEEEEEEEEDYFD